MESNHPSSQVHAAASCEYEFAVLNVFTRSPFGGNPAATVLLDELFTENEEYLYKKATANFNQPIVTFISRAAQDAQREQPKHYESGATRADNIATRHGSLERVPEDDIATFHVRYFTPGAEALVCGHGTIAAANWLFSRPDLVCPNVRLIRFLRKDGGEITARLLSDPVDSAVPPRVQIRLPAYTAVPVDDTKFAHVRKVMAKVWKRDVPITFVGVAKEAGEVANSHEYMMIELENPHDIQEKDLDKAAFAETDDSIIINVVVAASRTPGVMYESRMFAPRVGLAEDYVCGSANCLSGPYWRNKLGEAYKSEMVVKQASERGGDLWVAVDTEAKQIELSGETVLVAKGRIHI